MGKVDLLTNTLQPETGSSGFIGIPVLIGGLTGSAVFESGSTVTEQSVAKTVATISGPVGKIKALQQVLLSCSGEGKMEIYHGITLIGTRRTAPGKPDATFKFWPAYPIGAGETVVVKFTALTDPIVDVEAFLHSTEQSI